MSDEGKEIKPTSKFASVQKQWETIGGGKEEKKDMQSTITQKHINVETSKRKTTSYVRKSDDSVMKRQTVFLPEELADRLKVYAARHHNDMSGIIERLVEDFLDNEGA